MKINRWNITYGLMVFTFLVVSCQAQKGVITNIANIIESPTKADRSLEYVINSSKLSLDADQSSPRISFEKVVHNFGDIAIKEKRECEFRFKNIGHGLLQMGEIKSTCGCTLPRLSQKEYKPGEESIIKVKYSGSNKSESVVKHIFVLTNDPENPKVKLTIKARVLQYIEITPSKLQLSLKKNANIPIIKLKSKDGKLFSIKNCISSKSAIETEFDPNVVANEFVISPKADMQILKENRKGKIKFYLSHPRCCSVTLPYEVPTQFQTKPSMIMLHNVTPDELHIREIVVKNINKEQFEIKSISSKNGYVKVISKEQCAGDIKLKLQVTVPPIKTEQKYFRDFLGIKMDNSEKLIVRLNGFYHRSCFQSGM